MHKLTMLTTFAAASVGLSASAVLMAQPAETPPADTSAAPADAAAAPAYQAATAAPADPKAEATATDPLAPVAKAETADKDSDKTKDFKKKAAKKPR